MADPNGQRHHVAVRLDALVLVARKVVVHIYAGEAQLVVGAHGDPNALDAVPAAGDLLGGQQGGVHGPGIECSQVVDLAVLAVAEQVEARAVAVEHIQHIEGDILAGGHDQLGGVAVAHGHGLVIGPGQGVVSVVDLVGLQQQGLGVAVAGLDRHKGGLGLAVAHLAHGVVAPVPHVAGGLQGGGVVLARRHPDALGKGLAGVAGDVGALAPVEDNGGAPKGGTRRRAVVALQLAQLAVSVAAPGVDPPVLGQGHRGLAAGGQVHHPLAPGQSLDTLRGGDPVLRHHARDQLGDGDGVKGLLCHSGIINFISLGRLAAAQLAVSVLAKGPHAAVAEKQQSVVAAGGDAGHIVHIGQGLVVAVGVELPGLLLGGIAAAQDADGHPVGEGGAGLGGLLRIHRLFDLGPDLAAILAGADLHPNGLIAVFPGLLLLQHVVHAHAQLAEAVVAPAEDAAVAAQGDDMAVAGGETDHVVHIVARAGALALQDLHRLEGVVVEGGLALQKVACLIPAQLVLAVVVGDRPLLEGGQRLQIVLIGPLGAAVGGPAQLPLLVPVDQARIEGIKAHDGLEVAHLCQGRIIEGQSPQVIAVADQLIHGVLRHPGVFLDHAGGLVHPLLQGVSAQEAVVALYGLVDLVDILHILEIAVLVVGGRIFARIHQPLGPDRVVAHDILGIAVAQLALIVPAEGPDGALVGEQQAEAVAGRHVDDLAPNARQVHGDRIGPVEVDLDGVLLAALVVHPGLLHGGVQTQLAGGIVAPGVDGAVPVQGQDMAVAGGDGDDVPQNAAILYTHPGGGVALCRVDVLVLDAQPPIGVAAPGPDGALRLQGHREAVAQRDGGSGLVDILGLVQLVVIYVDHMDGEHGRAAGLLIVDPHDGLAHCLPGRQGKALRRDDIRVGAGDGKGALPDHKPVAVYRCSHPAVLGDLGHGKIGLDLIYRSTHGGVQINDAVLAVLGQAEAGHIPFNGAGDIYGVSGHQLDLGAQQQVGLGILLLLIPADELPPGHNDHRNDRGGGIGLGIGRLISPGCQGHTTSIGGNHAHYGGIPADAVCRHAHRPQSPLLAQGNCGSSGAVDHDRNVHDSAIVQDLLAVVIYGRSVSNRRQLRTCTEYRGRRGILRRPRCSNNFIRRDPAVCVDSRAKALDPKDQRSAVLNVVMLVQAGGMGHVDGTADRSLIFVDPLHGVNDLEPVFGRQRIHRLDGEDTVGGGGVVIPEGQVVLQGVVVQLHGQGRGVAAGAGAQLRTGYGHAVHAELIGVGGHHAGIDAAADLRQGIRSPNRPVLVRFIVVLIIGAPKAQVQPGSGPDLPVQLQQDHVGVAAGVVTIRSAVQTASRGVHLIESGSDPGARPGAGAVLDRHLVQVDQPLALPAKPDGVHAERPQGPAHSLEGHLLAKQGGIAALQQVIGHGLALIIGVIGMDIGPHHAVAGRHIIGKRVVSQGVINKTVVQGDHDAGIIPIIQDGVLAAGHPDPAVGARGVGQFKELPGAIVALQLDLLAALAPDLVVPLQLDLGVVGGGAGHGAQQVDAVHQPLHSGHAVADELGFLRISDLVALDHTVGAVGAVLPVVFIVIHQTAHGDGSDNQLAVTPDPLAVVHRLAVIGGSNEAVILIYVLTLHSEANGEEVHDGGLGLKVPPLDHIDDGIGVLPLGALHTLIPGQNGIAAAQDLSRIAAGQVAIAILHRLHGYFCSHGGVQHHLVFLPVVRVDHMVLLNLDHHMEGLGAAIVDHTCRLRQPGVLKAHLRGHRVIHQGEVAQLAGGILAPGVDLIGAGENGAVAFGGINCGDYICHPVEGDLDVVSFYIDLRPAEAALRLGQGAQLPVAVVAKGVDLAVLDGAGAVILLDQVALVVPLLGALPLTPENHGVETAGGDIQAVFDFVAVGNTFLQCLSVIDHGLVASDKAALAVTVVAHDTNSKVSCGGIAGHHHGVPLAGRHLDDAAHFDAVAAHDDKVGSQTIIALLNYIISTIFTDDDIHRAPGPPQLAVFVVAPRQKSALCAGRFGVHLEDAGGKRVITARGDQGGAGDILLIRGRPLAAVNDLAGVGPAHIGPLVGIGLHIGAQLGMAVVAPAVDIAIALAQQGHGVIAACRQSGGARQVGSALIEHGAVAGHHLAGHIGGGYSCSVLVDTQLALAVVAPGVDTAVSGPGQNMPVTHRDLLDQVQSLHKAVQALDRGGIGRVGDLLGSKADTQLSIGVIAPGPDAAVGLQRDHKALAQPQSGLGEVIGILDLHIEAAGVLILDQVLCRVEAGAAIAVFDLGAAGDQQGVVYTCSLVRAGLPGIHQSQVGGRFILRHLVIDVHTVGGGHGPVPLHNVKAHTVEPPDALLEHHRLLAVGEGKGAHEQVYRQVGYIVRQKLVAGVALTGHAGGLLGVPAGQDLAVVIAGIRVHVRGVHPDLVEDEPLVHRRAHPHRQMRLDHMAGEVRVLLCQRQLSAQLVQLVVSAGHDSAVDLAVLGPIVHPVHGVAASGRNAGHIHHRVHDPLIVLVHFLRNVEQEGHRSGLHGAVNAADITLGQGAEGIVAPAVGVVLVALGHRLLGRLGSQKVQSSLQIGLSAQFKLFRRRKARLFGGGGIFIGSPVHRSVFGRCLLLFPGLLVGGAGRVRALFLGPGILLVRGTVGVLRLGFHLLVSGRILVVYVCSHICGRFLGSLLVLSVYVRRLFLVLALGDRLPQGLLFRLGKAPGPIVQVIQNRPAHRPLLDLPVLVTLRKRGRLRLSAGLAFASVLRLTVVLLLAGACVFGLVCALGLTAVGLIFVLGVGLVFVLAVGLVLVLAVGLVLVLSVGLVLVLAVGLVLVLSVGLVLVLAVGLVSVFGLISLVRSFCVPADILGSLRTLFLFFILCLGRQEGLRPQQGRHDHHIRLHGLLNDSQRMLGARADADWPQAGLAEGHLTGQGNGRISAEVAHFTTLVPAPAPDLRRSGQDAGSLAVCAVEHSTQCHHMAVAMGLGIVGVAPGGDAHNAVKTSGYICSLIALTVGDLCGVVPVLNGGGCGINSQLAQAVIAPGPDMSIHRQGHGEVRARRDGHHVPQAVGAAQIRHDRGGPAQISKGGRGAGLQQSHCITLSQLAVVCPAPGVNRAVGGQGQRVGRAGRDGHDVAQLSILIHVVAAVLRTPDQSGLRRVVADHIADTQLAVGIAAPGIDIAIFVQCQGEIVARSHRDDPAQQGVDTVFSSNIDGLRRTRRAAELAAEGAVSSVAPAIDRAVAHQRQGVVLSGRHHGHRPLHIRLRIVAAAQRIDAPDLQLGGDKDHLSHRIEAAGVDHGPALRLHGEVAGLGHIFRDPLVQDRNGLGRTHAAGGGQEPLQHLGHIVSFRRDGAVAVLPFYEAADVVDLPIRALIPAVKGAADIVLLLLHGGDVLPIPGLVILLFVAQGADLLLRGEVIAHAICNDVFVAAHMDIEEGVGHIPKHLVDLRQGVAALFAAVRFSGVGVCSLFGLSRLLRLGALFRLIFFLGAGRQGDVVFIDHPAALFGRLGALFLLLAFVGLLRDGSGLFLPIVFVGLLRSGGGLFLLLLLFFNALLGRGSCGLLRWSRGLGLLCLISSQQVKAVVHSRRLVGLCPVPGLAQNIIQVRVGVLAITVDDQALRFGPLLKRSQVIGTVGLAQTALDVEVPQEVLDLLRLRGDILAPGRHGIGSARLAQRLVERIVTGQLGHAAACGRSRRPRADPCDLGQAGERRRVFLRGLVDGPAHRLDQETIAVVSVLQRGLPNKLVFNVQLCLSLLPVGQPLLLAQRADIFSLLLRQIFRLAQVQRDREEGRILVQVQAQILDVSHIGRHFIFLDPLAKANVVLIQRQGHRNFSPPPVLRGGGRCGVLFSFVSDRIIGLPKGAGATEAGEHAQHHRGR